MREHRARVGTGSHPSSNTTASVATLVTTRTRTAPPGSYLKNDGDVDPDDGQKGTSGTEQQGMVAAGHNASSAEKRAITATVQSYYSAAVAGNGTKGCSLLATSLATATAEGQPQTADCAASLSRLFAQQHQSLTTEDAGTVS